MTRRGWRWSALLLLAGCGSAQHMAARKLNTFDVAEPAAPTPAAGPQIAYSYALTYRLPGDRIANVQARQIALCRRLGPLRCLVLATGLSRGAGAADGTGSTKLLVDARAAVAFLNALDGEVGEAGGDVTERRTTAEDVTRQVIDVDARVRAKQALADRLTAIIRSRQGKVGELVEAEKAYADVQQALDAGRGEQADLRRRVAMSSIEIDYVSLAAAGTWAPVHAALAGLADTFAGSVGTLIAFVVAAIPWAALLALLVWIGRRRGWRSPVRRRGTANVESPARIG